MNELALFAGAGGGILGGKLLGWRTVCAVEINAFSASVLLARQNDGCLPPFPIWDDVRTFDCVPWRNVVDVVSGGFPCQDISPAGDGAGIYGERSQLWFEQLRVVRDLEPSYALVENSAQLTRRGLGVVLSGLAEIGYNARWDVLGAHDCGAKHIRKRKWILAYSQRRAREGTLRGSPERVGRQLEHVPWDRTPERALSDLRGMDDGLAPVVDRTNAIRNGQVPAVVRLAWETLKP